MYLFGQGLLKSLGRGESIPGGQSDHAPQMATFAIANHSVRKLLT